MKEVENCKFYCAEYDGCCCFNSSEEVSAVNPNEQNSCEAKKDCYYKQLLELQQKNNTLKERLKNMTETSALHMHKWMMIDKKLGLIREEAENTYTTVLEFYEANKRILDIIEDSAYSEAPPLTRGELSKRLLTDILEVFGLSRFNVYEDQNEIIDAIKDIKNEKNKLEQKLVDIEKLIDDTIMVDDADCELPVGIRKILKGGTYEQVRQDY